MIDEWISRVPLLARDRLLHQARDQRMHPTRLINYLKDPLRKNSVFLIGTDVLLSAFGFFFWLLAARLYAASDVGVAIAVISAAQLLSLFSGLGFDVGIIRFLPDEEDKPAMINSCFTIVGLFSVLLALCFVSGLNIWSPVLVFLQRDVVFLTIFVLLVIGYSLFWLQHHVFIGLRATEFSFIQSLIAGLRLALLPILVWLGTVGIVSSFGIGFCVALVVASFFIWKLHSTYRPIPVVRKRIVKDMVSFSFGNYIAESLNLLPGLILPMLVVNVVNPETGAYFYIAWMIVMLLLGVPRWTGSALLSEVSHGPQQVGRQVAKAARFMFVMLVPAILLLFFVGNSLLSLFGAQYAVEGSTLLRMLALSCVPIAFNELYVTLCLVDKKVKPVIYVRAFVAAATILGGYSLLEVMGLAGIGVAWLTGSIIVMLVTMPLMLRRLGTSVKGLLRGK